MKRKTTEIEKEKIISLKKNNPNIKHKDIAKIVGIQPMTVSRVLKDFKYNPLEIKKFREQKAEITEALMLKVGKELNKDERINEAKTGVLFKGYESLDKIVRLERGQSTENISMNILVKEEDEINKKRAEIENLIHITKTYIEDATKELNKKIGN